MMKHYLIDFFIIPMRVHGDKLLSDAVVLTDEECVHHCQVRLLIRPAVSGQKARRLALAVLLVVVAGKQVPAKRPRLHPQPPAALVPKLGQHSHQTIKLH